MQRLTERKADKQNYINALNDIIRRYGRMEDATIRQSISLLQDVRRTIADDILSASGFEAHRLTDLQSAISATIAQYETLLRKQINDAFNQAWILGRQSVTLPLGAAGVDVQFSASRAQLNALTGFSADLVKGISGDMLSRINTQLQLASLGERSPFRTMQTITDILGVKARDGVWGLRKRPEIVKGVAARAETIVRTELTRVHNIAIQSQQKEVANFIPEVRKRWAATGDNRTRLSHLQTHLDTYENPIPVDQPFIVGADYLMYPGDPSGSPAETINCRCRSLTVYTDIGVTNTLLDKAVISEQNKRQ